MTARQWLRALVSVGLVALTAWFIDLRGLGRQLAGMRIEPAIWAAMLSVPQLAITAWRWHFTAGRMGLELPFVRAWKEYYASTLLNLVLPGGVLGDVSRVVRVAEGSNAAKVARCVVLERASGQLALWLTIAIGALALGWPTMPAAVGWVGAAIVVVGIAIAVAVRNERIADSKIGAGIRTVVSEVRTSMLSGGAWAVQLGASLLAVALLGAMFYLCAVAVGAPVDGRQALLIAPLVLAASALPISVGGWGVREATAAGLFGLMGLDATQGAAASAAFGAVSLVTALPGAWVLLSKRGQS